MATIFIVLSYRYHDCYIFLSFENATQKVDELNLRDKELLKDCFTEEEIEEARWYIKEATEGVQLEGDIYVCKSQKNKITL